MNLNNLDELRKKFNSSHFCVGCIVNLSDPVVTEIIADSGYDIVWMEMEHSALTRETVLMHIMATRGTGAAPWVRVLCNDAAQIKPILEMEPAAIIVPMVNNASLAANAVAACRYPPDGVRGFGPSRGIRWGGGDVKQYIQEAQHQPLVIVQVEHIDAVRQVEEIVAVPGLDGICVGPNDLAGSMGKLGQTRDPEVVAAIDHVIDVAQRHNKIIGTATGYTPETIDYWMEKKLNYLIVGTDWLNLQIAARNVLTKVRQASQST